MKYHDHHKHEKNPGMKGDSRAKEATSVTVICMILNVFLTILKIAVGLVERSSALVADGFHSLSDFGSDIAVLLGFRAAKRPQDECHNYGHGKFETLTTVIIGVMLIVIALGILFSGTMNVIAVIDGKTIPRPGWIALGAAFISILMKEWMYHYTVRAGRRINSRLLIANAWHHRSDSLSSVGAMLGIGGAILLGGKWRILDPVAAIIVGFFIAKIAITLIREAIDELLEKSLDEGTVEEINKIIKRTRGVVDPHNLRTRRVGQCHAIDVHVNVDGNQTVTEGHDIATEIEKNLKKKYGDETIISIHIEPGESC